jgi:hypothetical protein
MQKAVARGQGTPHNVHSSNGEKEPWFSWIEVQFLDELGQVAVAHRRIRPHYPGPDRMM